MKPVFTDGLKLYTLEQRGTPVERLKGTRLKDSARLVIAMKRREFDRMIKEGRLMRILSFYPKVDIEGWK